MSSFYLLEISVEPGGSRKNDYYVFNNLADVRQALEDDLTDAAGLYLLLCYGATVTLKSYFNGHPVSRCNLLSYLTVQIAGYPAITFDGEGQPVGVDVAGEYADEREDDEEEEDEEDDSLCARLLADDIGDITVEVDWRAAAIPPLIGDPLPEGEPAVDIELQYGDHDRDFLSPRTLDYGYNDLA